MYRVTSSIDHILSLLYAVAFISSKIGKVTCDAYLCKLRCAHVASDAAFIVSSHRKMAASDLNMTWESERTAFATEELV